ncbi:leukotriene C4 synthase-like isoform X2 [Falco biarmicus]|uniref:leukotriene C4 synthase-like n=1 Tax=Falco rusticolus TaxID=120794 RepID=UPI00038702B2|nr:leukotriene C4 synthase isoform X2 [Falco peregrinus]XP_005440674.1 leukotriene C4 synthase isoform X2 [Falco cherrug]XP_037253426.1 leukotriene C4 synthase-like [Falco rusticolus]XP_040459705.1 leukotriene C4 synthase-like [Falco naumanni]XP_056204953.1 leukotriene C4 synthase-like isoform X2 [Falco biarmicus]
MRNQIDLLATVTVLGVLEQAYFVLQVIYARRKYKISPPETRGHPEFERIFRAQANCSEYFPIFMSLLWVAGIFFHQGVAAACGLMYLYKRFKYFQGYSVAAQGRLGPLYASALLLWLLLGLAVAGLLAHFLLSRSSAWTTVLVWPRQLLGAW